MEENMKAILSSAVAGDNAACEKLYGMTYKSAYATARSITPNEDDIEDILQEAYVRVFKKLNTIENPDKFKSWVNCIVANQTKDWLKKKKPTLFDDIGSSDEDSDFDFASTIKDEDESFSPEERLDKKAMSQIFATLFESLPEDQRLCIIMYYRDNLSVQEIADTLDVPVPTVKSRLLYAKKKIKASVEKEERTSGLKLYSGIPFILYMLHQEADSAYFLPLSSFSKVQTVIANVSHASPLPASGGKAASSAAAQGSKAAAAKTGSGAAAHAFAAISSHPAIAAIVASAAIATSVAVPALNTSLSSASRASAVSTAVSSVSAELVEQATSAASESESVASSGKAFYPVTDSDYPSDYIYSDFDGKYPYVVTDTREMEMINFRITNNFNLSIDNQSTGHKEEFTCYSNNIALSDTDLGWGVYYTINKMTIISKTECVFDCVVNTDYNDKSNIGSSAQIKVTGDSYDSTHAGYYTTVQVGDNAPVQFYPVTEQELCDYVNTYTSVHVEFSSVKNSGPA